MGRHADEERGRGLAGWLIGAISAVLVMVLAIVGYIVVLHRADSADQSVCARTVTLSVIAGPGAAPALSQAAGAYNETKPVVRSACVTATVTTASDDAVLAGLTGRWPVKEMPVPGVWIPDSTASLSALDGLRPDLAAGHQTDPIAWSPVVLAMRGADAAAVNALSWADLADATGPTGSIALPTGRHLILSLPPIASSRASSYALQSVVAGGDPSIPVDAATVGAKAALLKAIDANRSGEATTTHQALRELAESAGQGSGTQAVTAVPVVEADLVRFDMATAGEQLTAVHPLGSTVGDALIAAPISASWTDRTITASGSDFQAFLTSVAGQQILANHGWRTKSAHAAKPLATVDTQTRVTMVPAGGPAVDQAIAVALGQAKAPVTTTSIPTTTAPATTAPPTTTAPTTTASPTTTAPDKAAKGPVLTIIVDTSAGMAAEHRGTSLLDWVKKALPSVVDGTLTDQAGLWAYSDGAIYPPNGFPDLVPTGPLTAKATVITLGTDGAITGKAAEVRSKAMSTAIGRLKPDGDRWAYGALMEALPKVAKIATGARENRVILITSGVDQTPGTLRRQVLDSVKAEKGKLRLDVVGLGDAVPVDAYTDIAAADGGEYIPVPDPTTLGQQLADFLTLGD